MDILSTLVRLSRLGLYVGLGGVSALVSACGGATSPALHDADSEPPTDSAVVTDGQVPDADGAPDTGHPIEDAGLDGSQDSASDSATDSEAGSRDATNMWDVPYE
jgi:hypothetical protein